MYLLGYDVGSSSIKVCLLDVACGKVLASANSPEVEMPIHAPQMGWAEQNPDDWWGELVRATQKLKTKYAFDGAQVKAIGISYQMHGLVMVDKKQKLLHPSIIWCDSRAAELGNQAFNDLGNDFCLSNFLNSPGNFTAAKLKWIQENKPNIYKKIDKFMLPGDYIALRMTGKAATTALGLSEGIFWNFKTQNIANEIITYYDFNKNIVADIVETFAYQGELTTKAAAELGLKAGIPITYRAGDQPNNAFSLNVLNVGELAATAGTSGVVYGVSDQTTFDPLSRVNTFLHVNHLPKQPRYGVLLCINGAGSLNSWLKKTIAFSGNLNYSQMNELAAKSPIGSAGLVILPFGNGVERILENRNIDAQIHHLNFNIHNLSHLLSAVQEGIVFALKYGLDIMAAMGVPTKTVRAGHSNLFLSQLFREAFVNTTGTTLELYDTDGAQGAARAAGYGVGVYKTFEECFRGLIQIGTQTPEIIETEHYSEAYQHWKKTMEKALE